MPFPNLSELQLSDAPAAGDETDILNLTASVSENATSGNGFLEFVSESDGQSVVYTDALGNVTESALVLPSRPAFEFADTDFAALGFSSNTFAVLISQDGDPQANVPDSPGVLILEVGEDGTVVETTTEFIWPVLVLDEDGTPLEDASGEQIFEAVFSQPLILTRTDTGELGFTDAFGRSGAFDAFNVKDEYVEQFGFDGDTQTHVMLLADGSHVILADADASGIAFEVVHVAADGTEITRETFDFEDDLNALGLEADMTQIHADIDDNADLVFSFTDEDTTYATTLDLLPVTEVEDPLVDEGDTALPFEVLSQGDETQLPDGVTFGPVPTLDGGVQVEQFPTVDASGGSLQVVGFAGADVDLVYTADDGTTVAQTITLEGFSARASYDTAPVAYGENLDSFLLTAGRSEFIDEGGVEYINYEEAYVITPTGGGFESRLVTEGRSLIDFFGETSGGINTYLTPLGDGRVGWVSEEIDGTESQSGVIAEVDGVDIVVRLSADTILATDDGGVVKILQTDTGDFTLSQYNADYQLLESETLVRADLLAQSGLGTQNPDFTFFINDAGELDVYLSDPTDPEGALYKFELNLVTFDPDVTTATEFSDQLILTDGDDVIDISLGSDTVFGLEGDDRITEVKMAPSNSFSTDRDVIYGGGGNDTILLDTGTDRIYGGDDDDTLFGVGRADTLDGGFGDDTLYGGSGDDKLFGSKGQDQIYGGAGQDTIAGDNSNDLIFGGDGNDNITGDQGFDALRGGNGDDSLFGGRGKDNLRGEDGDDYLSGGSSKDFMRGNHGYDDGNDLMFGDAGNDKVIGFGGNDTLFGGQGNDRVHGGKGDDTLTSGEGDDLLTGAGGADVYVFDLFEDQMPDVVVNDTSDSDEITQARDVPIAQDNGTDTVRGFVIGEDKIVLDGSYLVGDSEATLTTTSDLTFEDIFLSQEDSVAVIQVADTTIRLKDINAEDLSADNFLLI